MFHVRRATELDHDEIKIPDSENSSNDLEHAE